MFLFVGLFSLFIFMTMMRGRNVSDFSSHDDEEAQWSLANRDTKPNVNNNVLGHGERVWMLVCGEAWVRV